MTGFNHAAVGGLLAVALPLPLAIPAAFISHFVLDMLPHYGIPQHRRDKSWFWRIFGTTDFLAVIFLIVGLSVFSWQRLDVLLCALIAVSPDFVWVVRIIANRSFDLSNNQSWFTKMHVRIQRFERPWGVYIEVPLAIALFAWLSSSVA